MVSTMKTVFFALLALFFATAGLAQGQYQVRPGDSLRVEVLEDPSLNRQVLVLPDGRFSFPFAGTILAGGRTLTQVEQAIAQGISENFATAPNVFVSIIAAPNLDVADGIDVYFLGEVNAPGLIVMERGTTFLQAVAQNGGFTRFAAIKRVQVRRFNPSTGEQAIYQFDLKALQDGAAITNNLVLRDGDVILVPERRLFE